RSSPGPSVSQRSMAGSRPTVPEMRKISTRPPRLRRSRGTRRDRSLIRGVPVATAIRFDPCRVLRRQIMQKLPAGQDGKLAGLAKEVVQPGNQHERSENHGGGLAGLVCRRPTAGDARREPTKDQRPAPKDTDAAENLVSHRQDSFPADLRARV